MSHEVREHDTVVLHEEKAWWMNADGRSDEHGLGIVVKDAPTPLEALRIAKLDWTVLQAPLQALTDDGDEMTVESHQLNYRSDTKSHLGIVGAGYRPIQNLELAEFCEALAEAGDTVKIETAGSIRNGQKVWFLLKGESFSVRGTDQIDPYICVSNGHDGWTALRCTPTTVRAVCKNTLSMIIPMKEPEGQIIKGTPAKFVAHHTSTIMERVEEAKRALQLYGLALDGTREMIDQLAARDVNREEIQQFFLECYTRDFGAIPVNPTTKVEQNARDRAMDACNAVFQRFDEERDIAGATAWNMANAYTGWLQNDRPTRIKDAEKAAERAVESKLFGVNADRSFQTMMAALAI